MVDLFSPNGYIRHCVQLSASHPSLSHLPILKNICHFECDLTFMLINVEKIVKTIACTNEETFYTPLILAYFI